MRFAVARRNDKAIPPALYALTASFLFGGSTPAAKVLLGQLSAQLAAGLLYLGSEGTHLVVSWTPGQATHFSIGSFFIMAACLCWAIDNNLTRKVSDCDPVQIAGLKGLVAGVVNCAIALAAGSIMPPRAVALTAAAIGLLSY